MFKHFLTLGMVAALSLHTPNAFAQDASGDDGPAEEAQASKPDPETQVNIRLLTHFHKKLGDANWGVGGWLILPNIVPAGPAPQLTPLFLIGPRYYGDGFWVEVMAGGLIAPDPDSANHNTYYNQTKLVQSTRFQVTPKAFGAPINMFGTLQFVDVGGEHPVTEQSSTVTYQFLMVDYVLPGKKALIGIETENYFGLIGSEMDGDELKTFNDIGIGPQVVFPFDNLNIIMAYQKHFHDDVDNQIWIRAMHNFGGPKANKKKK